MATKNYRQSLDSRLADIEYAAGYLDACLEEGDLGAMLIALQDVARVHGGLNHLAEQLELNRTALYRMLSEEGNPTLLNIYGALKALGLRLAIEKIDLEDPDRDAA